MTNETTQTEHNMIYRVGMTDNTAPADRIYRECMHCKKAEVPKSALEMLAGAPLVGFSDKTIMVLTDQDKIKLGKKYGYNASHTYCEPCYIQDVEKMLKDFEEHSKDQKRAKLLSPKTLSTLIGYKATAQTALLTTSK